jgi:putative endonuclease
MYYFYILQCAHNKLYVGSCQNVDFRFETHKKGNGADFTKQHKPLSIAYTEAFKTRAKAMRREAQIKNWSNAKKKALIAGDFETLHQLSASND